jgi:teichuronic acid biosynthesis glycosyltransferase TuaH
VTAVASMPSPIGETVVGELVVCSLEAWDDVWRRNQFLVDALLRRHPRLRVLYVEPPADPLFDLAQLRLPQRAAARTLQGGRLRVVRPFKPLPRRLGPYSDRALLGQVVAAVAQIGFARPLLWLNDLTYAPLIERTGWPTVYDVTDDWLLAPLSPRETERLRALDDLALARASEVVVCSHGLVASRGRRRAVTLIPNGVDAAHFQQPLPRPRDLPAAPTGVYVGTLHSARLDVELVLELAQSLPELEIVFVGPDSLDRIDRRRLGAVPNIHLLGPRPYAVIPAYLQHADVVLVPHRVTPFTESLDPIKAYECAVVDAPTVATPVAGFRDLTGHVTVASPAEFPAAVRGVLTAPPARAGTPPADWTERARAFESILARAAAAA